MVERQLPKLDTGVRFPSPAEFLFSTQGAGALSHNMIALKVTTGPVNARTPAEANMAGPKQPHEANDEFEQLRSPQTEKRLLGARRAVK
jgi:hypothetical protein